MDAFLFFLSLLWFIITLFKPSKAAPFFKTKPRLKSFFVFLIITVSLALAFPSPPKTPQTPPEQTKTEVTAQSTSTDTAKSGKDAIKHDVAAEKVAIQQIATKVAPNATELSVSEMDDGVYSLMFYLNVGSNDEAMARKQAVQIMQEIASRTQNKEYALESIDIITLYKKSPIGMYIWTNAKFSVSGSDEYTFVMDGKSKKFNP